jgi:hypothetical protein
MPGVDAISGSLQPLGALSIDSQQGEQIMNEKVLGFLIGLAIGLVLVTIVVVVFRWLWNTTMPDVFGLREISFWQAFRILLLASMLFGGYHAVEVPELMSTPPGSNTSPSN